MKKNSIEETATELTTSFKEELGKPFPYAGCRSILRAAGEAYEGFIPDLDMYFYNIASHCGGAKKILKWPRSNLLEAQKKLEKSFFEKYPEYKPLGSMMSQSKAPDLYAYFATYERMRIKLLEFLSQLSVEKMNSDTSH